MFCFSKTNKVLGLQQLLLLCKPLKLFYCESVSEIAHIVIWYLLLSKL